MEGKLLCVGSWDSVGLWHQGRWGWTREKGKMSGVDPGSGLQDTSEDWRD